MTQRYEYRYSQQGWISSQLMMAWQVMSWRIRFATICRRRRAACAAPHIGRFSSKPATLALWPFWDSKGWQATVFRAALQMIAASMHHLQRSSENCCLSTFWRCSEHAPSEAQLWKSTGNSSSLKTCQMASCKKHEKILKIFLLRSFSFTD